MKKNFSQEGIFYSLELHYKKSGPQEHGKCEYYHIHENIINVILTYDF